MFGRINEHSPGLPSGSDEAVECARKAAEVLQWGAVRMRGLRVAAGSERGVFLLDLRGKQRAGETDTGRERGLGFTAVSGLFLRDDKSCSTQVGPGETLRKKNPCVTGGISP